MKAPPKSAPVPASSSRRKNEKEEAPSSGNYVAGIASDKITFAFFLTLAFLFSFYYQVGR